MELELQLVYPFRRGCQGSALIPQFPAQLQVIVVGHLLRGGQLGLQVLQDPLGVGPLIQRLSEVNEEAENLEYQAVHLALPALLHCQFGRRFLGGGKEVVVQVQTALGLDAQLFVLQADCDLPAELQVAAQGHGQGQRTVGPLPGAVLQPRRMELRRDLRLLLESRPALGQILLPEEQGMAGVVLQGCFQSLRQG